MEIETLKKDNRKYWIIGSIVVLIIASVVFFASTRANYRVTEKVNIASGVINWSPSDLNIMAIRIQNNSGGYDSANTIPASGYILSNTSYCEVNGTKDVSIPMEYSNGKVTIGVNKKNTKCYLYFNKVSKPVITSVNVSEKYDAGAAEAYLTNIDYETPQEIDKIYARICEKDVFGVEGCDSFSETTISSTESVGSYSFPGVNAYLDVYVINSAGLSSDVYRHILYEEETGGDIEL